MAKKEEKKELMKKKDDLKVESTLTYISQNGERSGKMILIETYLNLNQWLSW